MKSRMKKFREAVMGESDGMAQTLKRKRGCSRREIAPHQLSTKVKEKGWHGAQYIAVKAKIKHLK